MDVNELFVQKKKNLNQLLALRRKKEPEILRECPACHEKWKSNVLAGKMNICPNCGYYFPMSAAERIELLADKDSFREIGAGIKGKDPLKFPGYHRKVRELQNRLGQEEAVVTGIMKLRGIKVAIGVMDSRFLMGSMGTVVGEKITALTEYADRHSYPLVIYCASGGARMQEGMFSLMQMAKTSAAIERFSNNGGLYISVLTNPTTGGVSASFANLGDIILAEPGALICFAGPRVIEQTIGEKLPKGFQRAEFLLEHGMVDRIVERREQRDMLHRIIKMHI